MALNVAELVGSLDMDVEEFERALNSSGDEFQDLVRRIGRLSEQAEEEAVIEPTVDDRELEQGLDQSGDQVASWGDRMAGLTAAAGAAAALAFGVALMGALEEQNVGAKVAAQLGYGAEDAKRFGKIAGELYTEGWGESIADIGEAIRRVQMMDLVDEDATSEDIKAAAREAQILADVFEIDVVEGVNAASQLVRTGLAKDATEAFDLITNAAQTFDKDGSFSDNINEYATQFRDLGVTGVEAWGLINQAIGAGARDADTVADAMKEFAIRAKDGSTTAAAGYKALGLDAEKMTAKFAKGGADAKQVLTVVIDRLKAMKDPVKQDAAAVALFGTKAEDLQDALFALDPATATQGMDNLAGATARAGATASDNAGAKIEAFKRTVEHAFVEVLGNKVLPVLESVVEWLSHNLGPALKATGKWLEKYEGWLKPIGVMLAAFVGPILLIVAAMKIWAVVTAAYTAVQMALNAALAANPIGLTVLAIAALVAGLIYAYKNSEAFRKVVDATWKGIATGALWLWNTILKPLFDLWWTYAQWVFGKLVGFFQWWWNTAKTYVGFIWGIVQGLGSAIKGIFDKVAGWVTGAFRFAVDYSRNAVNGLIALVNRAIGFINVMIGGLNKVPGINLPTLKTIPRLAQGGVVMPSRGGTPVIMGDGGQVEYGVPRDDMRAIIGEAVRAGGGRSDSTVTLIIEGRGVMRGIREQVRVQGGSAQRVLVGS